MGHLAALAAGPASVSIVNVGLWLLGLAYAVAFRRLLFAIAALLAAGIAAIIGLHDAGIHISSWLTSAVVYWRTPIVAFIVSAFVAGRYDPVGVGRRWRL